MTVVRVIKDKNFITMGKYHLKEKDMSLKAKGLLSQMLSLPDEWDYSVMGLTKINKESYDTIRGILIELEQFGYLQRTQIKNESGKFVDVEYTIYEKPLTEKPITENPLTGNYQQLNNKELNNNLNEEINNKKKYIKKDSSKEFEDEFEEIWKLYPKKVGKKDSLRHYIRNRKNGTSKETIENGLKNYIDYIASQNIPTQYIKDGSTWFNQESWNDERIIVHKETEEEWEERMEREIKERESKRY